MRKKKEPDITKIGIQIGMTKDTVKEVRVAINDILASKADQSTQVAALEALTKLCQVNGTSVVNPSITQG